jgi:uncharacterized membrane protein YkoI
MERTMKILWKTMTAACAAYLAMASDGARAEQTENDALQLRQAKIPLGEAVAIAEAKTGGRASKTEFEKGAEGWIFDVEVVAAKSVSDVHVDAETGAVLSVAEDGIDADDEEGPAD